MSTATSGRMPSRRSLRRRALCLRTLLAGLTNNISINTSTGTSRPHAARQASSLLTPAAGEDRRIGQAVTTHLPRRCLETRSPSSYGDKNLKGTTAGETKTLDAMA